MCRCLLIVALASVSLGAQQRGVNGYSSEKEAALGASLAAGVRKSVTVVENAALSQYVEQAGGKLIAALPAQGMSYQITVVGNDLGGSTHEPLALPGGAIFVPANLLLEARSEAEFAGMLAHAIAHVAARHGTRLATRAVAHDVLESGFFRGYRSQSARDAARV